ncbi:MAG TPA: hypothetical protein VGH72_33650 [Pseudonocardia sp.]|jgi:hypothetical protein
MSMKPLVAIGASVVLVGAVLASQWYLAVGIFVAYVGWTLTRTPARNRGGMHR